MSEYERCQLRDLAVLRSETVAPGAADGLPYIALEHLDSGDPLIRRWASSETALSAKSRFYPGDVLYGKLRPYLDKAGFAEVAGVASTELLVLEPRPRVDGRYLSYLMHSPAVLRHAVATTSGVNHPRTSWPKLGTLNIELPTLKEQRRIAGILKTMQDATNVVRAGARLRHRIHAALREKLFASNTTLAALEMYLREPLRNGHSAPADSAGSVRTLTLSAVTNNAFSERNTKLTNPAASRVRDLWLVADDILIERSNTTELVGSSAIYNGPSDWAIFPDLLIRIRTDTSRMLPAFLAEYLQLDRVRAYFSERATGTAASMSKIDQTIVGNLPVPDARMSEQLNVVRALATAAASHLAALRQAEASMSVFNATHRALMADR